MVIACGSSIRVGNYQAAVQKGKVTTLTDLSKYPQQENCETPAGKMPELEKTIVNVAEKEFAKRPSKQAKDQSKNE